MKLIFLKNKMNKFLKLIVVECGENRNYKIKCKLVYIGCYYYSLVNIF